MFVLCDIGGSNMRVAVSGNGKDLGRHIIVPTPQKYSEGLATLLRIVSQLSGLEPIKCFSGGITGQMDRKTGVLAVSHSLPDWQGNNLVKDIGDALKTRVLLENDTAIVGLGEAVFGAGRGHDIVVYITISTGVGGIRIVSGKIDPSAFGFEPGHQIIGLGEGPVEFETMVSGKSVEEKYGKKPRDIEDVAVWEELARYAAVGVANTILHWSPDIVVLGGAMMNRPGIPILDVEKYSRQYLQLLSGVPKFAHSELGDIGGLYGAMARIGKS